MHDDYSLKKAVLEKIQNDDIQTIRVNIMDLTGIPRGRNIPVETFVRNVINDGVDYPSAMFYIDSSAIIVEKAAGGQNGFPSWILKPDLSTFFSLPWSLRVAKVIADITDSQGKPISYAPRTLLRKVLSEYDQHGLYVKGAFEFEFYTFKGGKDNLIPTLDFSNVYSEFSQIKGSRIIDEVMDGLRKIGSNPEAGKHGIWARPV